jgi:hypothetical protein
MYVYLCLYVRCMCLCVGFYVCMVVGCMHVYMLYVCIYVSIYAICIYVLMNHFLNTIQSGNASDLHSGGDQFKS